MRKLHLVGVLLAGMYSPAPAAEPLGEWLVANGGARIRIEVCANALWGVISWVREPGTDSQNPDPGKRDRSIVGVPILRNMKPAAANKWQGEIYNSQNGKKYSGNITLTSDDVLRIEGCVLGGIFCGGENWTRVQTIGQTAPAQKSKGKQTAPARPKDKTGAGPEDCYDG